MKQSRAKLTETFPGSWESSIRRIDAMFGKGIAGYSMKHRPRVRFAYEFRVKVEVKIEAAVGLRVINRARHQKISRVMVALGLHQAGVKPRQNWIDRFQFAGEDLKFFATAPFDERATTQMVEDLASLAVADGFHQTGNPRARIRLAEWNAPDFQEIQHELEMLEFLDGDAIEFFDARVKVAIFFQVQGGRGGLAFQVRVVHQHRGQVVQNLGQPAGQHLFV